MISLDLDRRGSLLQKFPLWARNIWVVVEGGWKELHKVLDGQWLQILPLVHREGAWKLRLAVPTVLQLPNPELVSRVVRLLQSLRLANLKPRQGVRIISRIGLCCRIPFALDSSSHIPLFVCRVTLVL